jgi:uncharacterized protein YeaO (DUF488 family)
MAISIVRLGTPRAPDEGPRLGTVRRPPRGVRKTEYARQNYYDAWLPMLSPSDALISGTGILRDRRKWPSFARRFEAELKRPDASHLLDALAALSHTSDFAIGCYCEDEQVCHRSILRKVLAARGAVIKP